MPLTQEQYDAFVKNTHKIGKCPSCGETISPHNGNLYSVNLKLMDAENGYPAIAQVCDSCYNIRFLKNTLIHDF